MPKSWIVDSIGRFNHHHQMIVQEQRLVKQLFDQDTAEQIRAIRALCRFRLLEQNHPKYMGTTKDQQFSTVMKFCSLFDPDSMIILDLIVYLQEFYGKDDISPSKNDLALLQIIKSDIAKPLSFIRDMSETFFDSVIMEWFRGTDVVYAKLKMTLDFEGMINEP